MLAINAEGHRLPAAMMLRFQEGRKYPITVRLICSISFLSVAQNELRPPHATKSSQLAGKFVVRRVLTAGGRSRRSHHAAKLATRGSSCIHRHGFHLIGRTFLTCVVAPSPFAPSRSPPRSRPERHIHARRGSRAAPLRRTMSRSATRPPAPARRSASCRRPARRCARA